MKKLGMALPMAALLGIAASLAGCGGTSTPVEGASSSGGSSSGSGGSSGSSGGTGTGTAALVYGCNWLFESDAQTANIFYPDTSAVYWVAALPDSIPSGDQIEIAGTSPTARYFSFEVYTENGKAESGANDAAIFGSAATPAQAVAAGQGYKLSVIYSTTAASSGTTLVADPANVSLRAPAHKFILYRLYLPTSGAADFGNLPVLTYVAQDGTRTPLSATPDQASCNTILNNIDKLLAADGASSGSGSSSSSGGLALAEPAIKPPSMSIYRSTAGRFQNLDVRYMREKTNATLGDLLLVRGKAPAFAGSGQTPQVRYWSVCSDGAHKPYPAVECLVDQDAHIGADGYYNVVISTDTPPAGYQSQFDYLPFGADAFGQPIYRQLLAAPSFSQSIDNSSILLGPKLTMGDYYPDTAYCSSSVFSSNLAAGAAAVFAACKSSQGVGIVPDLGN